MEKGISKAQWIEQVNRELKDSRSWKDLKWLVDEGLEIEAFYHPDDHIFPVGPILWRGSNKWQIATWNKWPVEKESLEHQLQSGVESVIIECASDYTPVAKLIQGLRENHKAEFQISILQSDGEEPGSTDNLLIRSGLTVNGLQLFEISTEVKGHIDQIVNLLEQLLKSPEHCQSVLMIPIGQTFLAEIAKIRALKVIILNLWNSQKRDRSLLPEIECHVHPDSNVDAYTDLISKSGRAVICVVAGCDRLVLHRHKGDELPKHLDVNIHHILSHEGGLDTVEDPLAGSYIIDRITQLFVEHSWRRLKETWAGQIESK